MYKVGDRVKTRTGIKNIAPKFKTVVLEVTHPYDSCGIVTHPDGETALVGWEEVERA